MGRFLLALATVWFGSVIGCSLETTTTPTPTPRPPRGVLGKNGKVGFSLHSNTGKTSCTFGCALMKGTDENLWIDPEQPGGSTFESSDPSVAEILSPSLSGFVVRARGSGVVELRVKSASGDVVDRIDLPIEVPAQVTFPAANTTVKVGQTIFIVPSAMSQKGELMQSSRGWTFSGDAPAIAQVSNACALICYGNNDYINVKGVKPGTVNVTAKGAGAEGSVAVTVTP